MHAYDINLQSNNTWFKDIYLNLRYKIYINEIKRSNHILLKTLQKINQYFITNQDYFSRILVKLKIKKQSTKRLNIKNKSVSKLLYW